MWRWLGIVMVAIGCSKQEALDPPPLRHFHAWLGAFNAADKGQLVAFHAKHFPYKDRSVEDELEFRNMTGGFALQKVEVSTATKAEILVREQAGEQFARITVEVDARDAEKLTKLDANAIPPPPGLAPKRLTEAAALAALADELARQVREDRFAGVVAVAKDGAPIFQRAYGLANRATKAANTVETRFRIGSMNKMFTATAILRLAQDGKLALTDTVGKHLPAFPNEAIRAQVTLHQLLTHTGGTGDFFGPEFEAHRLELRTHDDFIRLLGARPPTHAPGEKFQYSNFGFIMLGAVIEHVTGKSYYDAVAELVYQPAGMTGTRSPPIAELDGSVGYMRGPDGAWTPNTDTLPYRGTAAGGGDTTAGDLLAFADAIRNDRVLDGAHTKLLTTGQIPRDPGVKYAYGFSDSTRDGIRCIGHGGGAPGMNGELLICDNGYTIVVLANLDPPAAGRIADFLFVRLPAK